MQAPSWASTLREIGDYSGATIALINYWVEQYIELGGRIPERSEFSLKTIAPNLDQIFLSEWHSYERMEILASGSTLVSALGVDLTGKNIFEYVPAGNKKKQQDYYVKLQGQPCAGLLVRWGANMKGRPFIYRTIQLPLMDKKGTARFFIGTGLMQAVDSLNYGTQTSNIVNIDRQEHVFLDVGSGVPDDLKD